MQDTTLIPHMGTLGLMRLSRSRLVVMSMLAAILVSEPCVIASNFVSD